MLMRIEQNEFMYTTSVVDPDGNILEIFYMDISKFPKKDLQNKF